jgi:sporulation protein YlmC with PRC-barrel domain
MGKEVFTPEGRCLGEVLDVALYSFSRVKELIVGSEEGVVSIDGDLIERVEADRILLKGLPGVNEP